MIAEHQKMKLQQGSVVSYKDRTDFFIQFIQARHEMKLTQVQLAKKAGVTQAMIARIENGQASPTYQTLAQVAAVLGRRLTLTKV